jgi:tetratricopeptide (TPR) repeat protein
MVMQAAGLTVTADALTSQVYLPGRQGSLQVEMLSATRRHALLPYRLKPRLQDILQEVSSGNPVIVFQNLSLPVYPVWHYAVVVGYSLERNTVTLHSGRTERMEMSLFTFERTWERAGSWAMVAMNPSTLPASASPDEMALAAAALELVEPAAAHTAYETALAKWPKKRSLRLGLGNSSYAQRNFSRARKEYREAVALDPEFADGWNNLAQVLLDEGNKEEGLAAIAKAIQIGGPRLALYEDLSRQFNVQ